jgi:hypothetical protein
MRTTAMKICIAGKKKIEGKAAPAAWRGGLSSALEREATTQSVLAML